jgi:hypothetical protein
MCFLGANFPTMATKKIDFFFWGFLSVNFLRRNLLKWKKNPNFQSHKMGGGKEPLGHDPSKFRISD